MHVLNVIPVLFLMAVPSIGQPVRMDMNSAAVQQDCSEARWAEWEAQSRMIGGDYDGAVQAEQQANADRQKLERQQEEERSLTR